MKNNYILFKQAIEFMIKKPSEYYKSDRRITPMPFVHSFLDDSHRFIINDSIKKLFLLTDNNTEFILDKLPFDELFLDVHINKEDNEHIFDVVFKETNEAMGLDYLHIKNPNNISGILLKKIKNPLFKQEDGKVFSAKDGKYDKFLNEHLEYIIKTFVLTYADDLYGGYDINELSLFNMKDILQKLKINSQLPTMRKVIVSFINNFLAFINDSDVEIVQTERLDKQLKRDNRKFGVNGAKFNHNIILKGKVKEYIDQLEQADSFNYHYKFWVRGHYRTLRADRYNLSKGKKLWIMPFIKGHGILIKKEYQIENMGVVKNANESIRVK